MKAVCAVEGDRAVVEGNVASVMRGLKLLPLDSTHEEALLAFDLMVQTTMPRAIRDSVGAAKLRYELLLTVLAPQVFAWFDLVGAQVLADASGRVVVTAILYRSAFICALLPLGIALATQLSARCTHLRGLKRIVFVLFNGVMLSIWVGFGFIANELVHSLAEEDLVAFVISCLAWVMFLILTLLVFWRPTGQQRRRRTGAVSETMEELAEALGSYMQQIGRQDVRR